MRILYLGVNLQTSFTLLLVICRKTPYYFFTVFIDLIKFYFPSLRIPLSPTREFKISLDKSIILLWVTLNGV